MSDEKAKMKTKEYWLKVGHDDEFSALYAEVHQKAYSREQCLNRGISFAGRTKFEKLRNAKKIKIDSILIFMKNKLLY